jgi:rod shape-determining protein MreB
MGRSRRGFFRFGKDIGIDLGTSTVLVYVKGRGLVLTEPSLLAVDRQSRRLLKTGAEAQALLSQTPGSLAAFRPIRQGVISDYEKTVELLRVLLRDVRATGLFRPRLLISLPPGGTEVEARAVIDAGLQAGARQVRLLEQPLAALMGAGVDITGPYGHMVVDIGGGTTDIAVVSLGQIMASASLKVAGDQFDEAIVKHIRSLHQVLLGVHGAELLKRSIGCAIPLTPGETVETRGRDLETGLPKTLTITSTEIAEALDVPIQQVLEGIAEVLERTPPELVSDIAREGILLTGGGVLLRGLTQRISASCGLPVRLAEDPHTAVIYGLGKALESAFDDRSGRV